MKRVISEEKPLLIGYDESAYCPAPIPCSALQAELKLLEGMRLQMELILCGLPESTWERVGVHSEQGSIPLKSILEAEV